MASVAGNATRKQEYITANCNPITPNLLFNGDRVNTFDLSP